MAAGASHEPPYTDVELTAMRRAIGERVARSRSEIPEFRVVAHIDAAPLVELRRSYRDVLDPTPSLNDLILKLCGIALREHPNHNAAFVDGRLRLYQDVNIGFAVATDQGVVVPVLRGADHKPIAAIAEETRSMVALARAGKLRASLQLGGTFSISNIGPGHIEAFDAIISPPQTAILAIGSLANRPYVICEELAARPTLYLTLAVDHRAIDGAEAAAFLETIARLAAEPRPAVGDP